jgi:molybdenum cofactor guanylyltransferase
VDVAAIVLAGGRSSRMGVAKAGLEWHRSTMLHRVCGVLGRAVNGPIIVVAAAGQELPTLPRGVKLVEDPREGLGPVQGLAAGLSAAADLAPAAYVSATDVPFLHPAFVRRVVAAFDGSTDIVLPDVDGVAQPLAAVYATSVGAAAQQLVDQQRLRFAFVFARCTVRRLNAAALLEDEELAAVDPQLESLLSVDDMDAYQKARSRPAPQVMIERIGALVREVDQGARPVRAATLGAAATAAGVELGAAVAVTIDGAPVWDDPELPLVAGDHVAFAPAAATAPAAPAAPAA